MPSPWGSPRRKLTEKEAQRVEYIVKCAIELYTADKLKEETFTFISSVEKQFLMDGKLSDKQLKGLEKVYKVIEQKQFED